VQDAAKIIGEPLEGLADLGTALMPKTGADIVLAVKVRQEPAAVGNSVRADVEIVLLTAERFGAPVRATGEWTTSSGEVSRLVGLVALNLLRRWLLIQGRGARQLNAV
jgi:hypothetical protein